MNVSAHGFRVTKPSLPWPPDNEIVNIFIFGGSTTFGYGIPDEETIAVYLQDDLNKKTSRKVHVYNFGRGFYFSTSERILFENLLLSGVKPTLAVFLDGLNEFYFYNDKQILDMQYSAMKSFFSQKSPTWFRRLPLTQLIERTKSSIFSKRAISSPKDLRLDTDGEKIFNDRAVLGFVINRYLHNKKMIEALAQSYKIKAVFVWQPIPLYQYDPKHILFPIPKNHVLNYAQYGYAEVAKRPSDKLFGPNFLWIADIHKDIADPLYIDSFHYSAKLNKMIAEKISDFILSNDILLDKL